jgi:uncharacterized protein (TIGR00251 family)
VILRAVLLLLLLFAVIPYTQSADSIVFKVQVVPRASRSEIVGEHNGALRVRIAAPPVDGAANEELVKLLARVLRVPRSAVEITTGHSAKLKTVRVAGLESSAIRNLFVPQGPKR